MGIVENLLVVESLLAVVKETVVAAVIQNLVANHLAESLLAVVIRSFVANYLAENLLVAVVVGIVESLLVVAVVIRNHLVVESLPVAVKETVAVVAIRSLAVNHLVVVVVGIAENFLVAVATRSLAASYLVENRLVLVILVFDLENLIRLVEIRLDFVPKPL